MKINTIQNDKCKELGSRFSRTLFVIVGSPQNGIASSNFRYLTQGNSVGNLLVSIGSQTYILNESSLILDELLLSHESDYDRIALDLSSANDTREKILQFCAHQKTLKRRGVKAPMVCDAKPLVGLIRMKKSEQEIEIIRKAANLSSLAHTQLMKVNLIGRTEAEIATILENELYSQGLTSTAYPTIVGAGERSTLPHAEPTLRRVQAGEVLLIDGGGCWKHYAADITRCVPSGNELPLIQKEIYNLVLSAQSAAIDCSKPGSNLQKVHQCAREILLEGLRRIFYPVRVTDKDLDELFPHSTSHWIGMDVHDACPYVDDSGRPFTLDTGMIFTIEPALYFSSSHRLQLSHHFGVRIEDMVLINTQRNEVLTSAPRILEEIENLKALSK